MSEIKNDRIRQASLTVETALLMPIVIFTVLMAVYLTAHIHNRTWLSSSAGEQAVSGHVQEDPDLFAAGEILITRDDYGSGRTVSGKAGTFHFSGEKLWEIDVKQTFRKVKPVRLIRAKNALNRNDEG